MDHQDVHGGRLPTGPAKEDLVLRLRLRGEEGVKGRGLGWGGVRGGGPARLTQLYTSSPSLLLRMRRT